MELAAADLAPYLFGIPAVLLLVAGTTHLLTLRRMRATLTEHALLPLGLVPAVPTGLAVTEIVLGLGGVWALLGDSVALRRGVSAASVVLGAAFVLYLAGARRRAPQQPCGCLPLPTALGSGLVFLPAGAVVLLSLAALSQTFVEASVERTATTTLQTLAIAVLLMLLPAADARSVPEVEL